MITDAEKCFYKLWLKDCCNELYQIGIPATEVKIIEELNTEIEATIDTPLGITEKIKMKEAVKQGTVMVPTMCIIETDKVNTINEKAITIGPEIKIESLIFVDDILASGSRDLRAMEKQKKFTFSKDKTKIVKIKNNRKKDEEIPKVTVEQGQIEDGEEEKYLGEWFSSKGNNEVKIRKKAEKTGHMIQEIKRNGDQSKVGNMDVKIRFHLLQTVVMPVLLYNMETWIGLTKKDEREMEKIHGKILKGIMEQEKGTPYWGLIKETGIWPIKQEIHYKKLMLVHEIMNSEDERIIKKIIKEQKKREYKGWYEEIRQIAEEYNVDIRE